MITWRFIPLGEAALLVQGAPADDTTNRYALALAAALDRAALHGVERAVPAIDSVLIPFEPNQISHATLETAVRDLIDRIAPAPAVPARIVEIPVRYGGEHGPDLIEVAERLALAPAQVVALHAAPLYRVRLIGFAPGFPYLGPLPARLHLPRRSTPRTAVPAGSVAIAADMSGIYPARLPGGWHVLGRTTLRLFDPTADPPSTLQAGDGVRFVPQSDGIVP